MDISGHSAYILICLYCVFTTINGINDNKVNLTLILHKMSILELVLNIITQTVMLPVGRSLLLLNEWINRTAEMELLIRLITLYGTHSVINLLPKKPQGHYSSIYPHLSLNIHQREKERERKKLCYHPVILLSLPTSPCLSPSLTLRSCIEWAD